MPARHGLVCRRVAGTVDNFGRAPGFQERVDTRHVAPRRGHVERGAAGVRRRSAGPGGTGRSSILWRRIEQKKWEIPKHDSEHLGAAAFGGGVQRTEPRAGCGRNKIGTACHGGACGGGVPGQDRSVQLLRRRGLAHVESFEMLFFDFF
jgi:hypothetical protein